MVYIQKITLLLILCIIQKSLANNIQLSNISITGQNTSSDFTMVQFDLTWENSWRISTGPSNWDAAWVFVKYRVGSGPWLHAFLNETGHITGTGTAVTITSGLNNTADAFNTTTNPAMGAFVHRSGDGTGTFTQNSLQLRWNYGANSIADGQAVDIKVFAVEMVYVPQGSFYLGSGGTESGSFTNGSWISGATIPFQITSEAALGIDKAAGKLWGTSSSVFNTIGNLASDAEATLEATYPKGYAAFYCMKYEISQGQYRDFLNVLAYGQQVSRTNSAPDSPAGIGAFSGANANRNGLDIQTPGNATTFASAVYGSNLIDNATYNESVDGENIPCNFLSWMDGAAFADWASLRPMTELEFEKACRGTITPVANEFAWGSSTIHAISYASLSDPGAANELANAPSTTNGNAAYTLTANISGIQGPLRVGSFATASSTRAQAGASYYGIMELSGNLSEQPVSVGHATGRNFTAPIHGNGLLTSDGFCDISTWPGFVTNKVTGATGAGFRGGTWVNVATNLRTSYRGIASWEYTGRLNTSGFRAVRSVL